MRQVLCHVPLSPVAMGVCNISLSVKFHIVLPAFRVCLGFSSSIVQVLMGKVLSCTTDFGTESGLGTVPGNCPDSSILHWQPSTMVDDDATDTTSTIPLCHASPSGCFSGCMNVPGSEHIGHGVLEHVTPPPTSTILTDAWLVRVS